MSKPNEERDIYYIPPNFLASGRLFGGMIRARNAIEACVLVLLTGIPIIKLPMSLTVRIIILCLLPLPLGIFGIIGFEGDSLSEFAINWVRWFIHRRNLYRSDVTIPETARKQKKRIWEQEATKPPEELGIRIKQPRKKRKRPAKTEKQLNKNNRKMVPSHKKQVTYSEDFVPVKDIRNGIIEMEDGRYIRVLEVEPINFLLRSTSEQKNIVASFASWMKISPIKIQIKVLTKKADIGKHLSTIERDMESESNPKCRELQLDYYRLIQTIGSREAITRRFLVIFEYEAVTNRKPEYLKMEDNRIQNQIAIYMTNKKLCEFTDKLKPAPIEYYAHMHAQGEEQADGIRAYSCIGVVLQDYSNGTGDKTVRVTANLSPGFFPFVLSRMQNNLDRFDFTEDKIFGEPDEHGLSTVTKLSVKRASVGTDGKPRNYPWCVIVENGRAVKEKTATGGTHIKSGTYKKQRSVYVNINDLDFFNLVYRTTRFIESWELTYGPKLIRDARKLLSEQRAATQQ